jgi:hypothetical protein
MSDEMTPERKEYLVNQAAEFIVKNDLEDFAIIALEGTAPFGDVVGELGIMMSYPLAVTFFDRFGSDFVKLFGFNYQENAEVLIEKINALSEEKKRQRKIEKDGQKNEEKSDGWFSNLISQVRSLFKGKKGNNI